MPLAPSLTFEDVFGNTYQILCLVHLELEDGVLSCQCEVDDVHDVAVVWNVATFNVQLDEDLRQKPDGY